jgi:two-component system phosphate regulon sensor histidine kinase PhoR
VLRSLRARLFLPIAAATILVVAASAALAPSLLEYFSRRDVADVLSKIVDRAHRDLARGRAPDRVATSLGASYGAQVSIFGVDGRLLAGSAMREVGFGTNGIAFVRERDDGSRSLVLALRRNGFVVRAARALPPRATTQAVREMVLLAGLIALCVAGFVTALIARSIGQPIREMSDAADALGRGQLSRRVRSRRRDELGALASAIDQMADQLVERYEAVRREEGRLRTILDAMDEGVLVTDREGRIVLTNAALINLAGEELEGRTAVEAIRSAELHEAVREAAREKTGRDVQVVIGAGSLRRSLTARVAPLPTRRGVVAVLHDVTQLERIDAVRRDFVANASHELRTPLTAIVGFAETLLDGALSDEHTAKRFVNSIAQNAKRLEELVEDLLELSRAESPESKLDLAPIDVVSVAARVLAGLEQRATDKRQQLILDGAGAKHTARADPRALDTVLVNLVDNAVKYTPEGGTIRLAVRRDGDRVSIEVSDNGPGIPRAHQSRIFERFYRVDKGRARTQGGTGLGLSIVRHLVTRMRGEISVASRVGEGSTFRVSLAAAQSER